LGPVWWGSNFSILSQLGATLAAEQFFTAAQKSGQTNRPIVAGKRRCRALYMSATKGPSGL